MRTLTYHFATTKEAGTAVRVGVVGSGDLEVLLEPGSGDGADVRVRTSVRGFDEVWLATLTRFFQRVPLGGRWELNDAAATPALVTLRLQQAAAATEVQDR